MKKIYNLVLGVGLTQELDDATITAQCSINFTRSK